MHGHTHDGHTYGTLAIYAQKHAAVLAPPCRNASAHIIALTLKHIPKYLAGLDPFVYPQANPSKGINNNIVTLPTSHTSPERFLPNLQAPAFTLLLLKTEQPSSVPWALQRCHRLPHTWHSVPYFTSLRMVPTLSAYHMPAPRIIRHLKHDGHTHLQTSQHIYWFMCWSDSGRPASSRSRNIIINFIKCVHVPRSCPISPRHIWAPEVHVHGLPTQGMHTTSPAAKLGALGHIMHLCSIPVRVLG